MSSLLSTKGLTKRFGGLVAIDEVNLELREGEIVGVLGPNGAGKTTLFNLLSGFLPPTAGTVEFHGRTIMGLAPHAVCRLGVCRTFQLPRPFAGLTVFQNVQVAAMGCRQLRTSNPLSTHDILRWVGLDHQASLKSERLSYGDLRRLEIARALATRPKVLLLDEPFAGLGVQEIRPIAALIRKMHEEQNVTIVLIEHKLREFMQLVDRVIAFNFGRVIADDSPANIVKNTAVIESYIGRADTAYVTA